MISDIRDGFVGHIYSRTSKRMHGENSRKFTTNISTQVFAISTQVFGHLDTGFSWFPLVQERMLRWFPPFQVASTCFSCSPPDLNSVVTNCLLSYYVKWPLPPGDNPTAVNKYYYYYYKHRITSTSITLLAVNYSYYFFINFNPNTFRSVNYVGRDGSVGIATSYVLDGLGIESRWGRDASSRPALGLTQPPILGAPGLSRR